LHLYVNLSGMHLRWSVFVGYKRKPSRQLAGRVLSIRGKKVGFPETNFVCDFGNSGIEILEPGAYERVFCKVISEIKNGMATDLH